MMQPNVGHETELLLLRTTSRSACQDGAAFSAASTKAITVGGTSPIPTSANIDCISAGWASPSRLESQPLPEYFSWKLSANFCTCVASQSKPWVVLNRSSFGGVSELSARRSRRRKLAAVPTNPSAFFAKQNKPWHE